MTASRPDVSIISIHGKTPRIHDSAFIAPGCRIIGDVEIGPDASIWYNCVLRGDVSQIVIGARTNVQDGTVIHCDSPMPGAPNGFPTLIGEDVLIGHMAMIHGTVIHDRGFVGFSAQTMNGCVIEEDGMLAAGAMLALLVMAMGTLNNTFQRGGEVSVGLTYMTGALVRMGQGLAAWLMGTGGEGWSGWLLLWLGLALGAVLGAIGWLHAPAYVLWIAAGWTGTLAFLSRRLRG